MASCSTDTAVRISSKSPPSLYQQGTGNSSRDLSKVKNGLSTNEKPESTINRHIIMANTQANPMRFQWFNFSPLAGAGTDSSRIHRTRMYQYVSSQPNWITRAALTAFAVVIILPIFVLVFLALLLASILFGSLALLNLFTGSVPRGFNHHKRRDSEGRKNVSVLPSD